MAQDSQNIDSLYDFLYLDRERLASFMAQVFDDGVLTASKKTEQTADTNNDGIELGIPKLAKGTTNAQTTNTLSQEMHFDASWTLPLNVLDGLDQHGFIHRGLERARIGQLHLVSGLVSVLDIKLLQQMWSPMADVIAMTIAGPSANHKATSAAKAQVKSFGGIIDKLPQAVQMTLSSTTGDKAWMTLKNESMVISSDELALKHGGYVSGEWIVLGVIDALPDEEQVERPVLPDGLVNAMVAMLDMVKQMVGRPSESYGITPILIFRQISKN